MREQLTKEEIKNLRKAAELTQGDLAKAVGVTREEIARIEAGKVTPRIDTARAIARALGQEVGSARDHRLEKAALPKELSDPDLAYVQTLCWARSGRKTALMITPKGKANEKKEPYPETLTTGITQEQLSRRSGVSLHRIRAMENGRLAVEGVECELLARGLNIDPELICSREPREIIRG